MTQEATPVGGSNEPVAAPTIDDRLSAALEPATEEQQEEEDAPLAHAEDAIEGEAEADPEIEVEAEPEEDAGPPIDAPLSWKAEEKEAFAKLPREVQEVVTRREAERERFVQAKAQEAANAQRQAATEAMQAVEMIRFQQAQELETFAAQIVPQKPPARLMAEDPAEYAAQMEAFEYWTAQRQHAQQAAHQRRQEAEYIRQQQEAQAAALEAQQTEAILSEKFPEYLDPNVGPKLREQLGAVAIELGYPPELLREVNAQDILAMKQAADWKAKAEKWDRAMEKQMERVRQGKSKLPPIAKPGASQGPGASQQAAYQADREAMRRGDRDAEQRVIARLFNS